METMRSLGNTLAFVKVAQYLSYSKAANDLGVSKAYISKSIQQLESEVGQKLLNRTTRLVKLTREGEKFYETCLESINSIQNAKDNIKESIQFPQGLLRVTAAGAFAEEYITPVATRLLAKYPKLRVEVSLNERIVNLVEENFDLGIRVGHLYDSSMIAKRMATRREFVCATRKYLLDHGIPKSPKELKEHNCLTGNNNQWHFKERQKEYTIKVGGNFMSNNARVLLKASLSHIGIVKLPEAYVGPYLESGELVEVLGTYLSQEIPIWAIYPATKRKSTNVSFFLDELEKEVMR
ncbi:MAG: LysR family transcriptional regulator [Halobacteriovoraceae bacterium]|nr:LysR family transcriptional regulator [Halobacteriovoraceae bacterium]MBC96188.1 LysR family transcriptional regulator [Halobacteriovoraceae bacterium]|tara:strand:+ start:136548 stop:137429 length:882 start_codon:yes stop_codon:yes gene_type:complete